MRCKCPHKVGNGHTRWIQGENDHTRWEIVTQGGCKVRMVTQGGDAHTSWEMVTQGPHKLGNGHVR